MNFLGEMDLGKGSHLHRWAQNEEKVWRESRKPTRMRWSFQAAIEAVQCLPPNADLSLHSDSRILIDCLNLKLEVPRVGAFDLALAALRGVERGSRGMDIGPCEDGVFDGGLLFDGCGYRKQEGIVAFSHGVNRLGIVRDKRGYFVAEFLAKIRSQQFSLPIWDAVRDPVLCGSVEEGKVLIDAYVGEGAKEG